MGDTATSCSSLYSFSRGVILGFHGIHPSFPKDPNNHVLPQIITSLQSYYPKPKSCWVLCAVEPPLSPIQPGTSLIELWKNPVYGVLVPLDPEKIRRCPFVDNLNPKP